MEDNYGILADDRINELLDFSQINSREDYFKELQRRMNEPKNERLKNLWSVRDKLYEDSKARTIVEQKQLESFQEAQRFEKKRPLKSRIPDEKRTSRRTRPATRINIRRWKRNPQRSDIRGIDTKLAITTRKRQNIITKKDISLRNKGIRVNINIRGIKQYRDNKGRFVSKKQLN